MKIGTKSVLFGAHCFLIHPWFVAAGWFTLHGFRRVYIGQRTVREYVEGRTGQPVPVVAYRDVFASLWSPALWIAFLVHDIGYLGKPNMDGPEGEQHPFVGARVLAWIFDKESQWLRVDDGAAIRRLGVWGQLVLYHSRFLAKQYGAKPSPLCMADKLAFPLTPRWLYLPMVRATGEIHEYMAKADKMNRTGSKYDGMHHPHATQEEWWNDVAAYVTMWVDAHKDGRDDTWTSSHGDRRPIAASGVHQ